MLCPLVDFDLLQATVARLPCLDTLFALHPPGFDHSLVREPHQFFALAEDAVLALKNKGPH